MDCNPSRSTIIRRLLYTLLLGTVLVGITACDSGGPETTPASEFDLTVGAPVDASLKGRAALANDLSFDEQGVFTVPVGPFGKTVTIIQLSGENESGVVHDLSFMRLAEDRIEEGTYELGRPCGDGCELGDFPPEELFTASYGRRTADSLHSYPIESGTVTVESVTDESVRGTFTLTTAVEASVAQADLQAFIDSLRARPPRDTTAIPGPPPTDLQFLEPPTTIEGRFTATAGEQLSERVPHFGGIGFAGRRDTLFGGP